MKGSTTTMVKSDQVDGFTSQGSTDEEVSPDYLHQTIWAVLPQIRKVKARWLLKEADWFMVSVMRF